MSHRIALAAGPLPAVHLAAVTLAAALALTSCATAAAPGSDAPPGSAFAAQAPAPPTGAVVAQGTVLDDGTDVQVCVGPVAESAPPQCSGLPLVGWTWEGVDDATSSGGSTWGTYAVTGTYDGDTLTVTRPAIPLALHDPMAVEDPTGGEPGTATAEQVADLQECLPDLLGEAYLGSYERDGWVFVQVVWDDGTWQQAADEDYGAGAVVIVPALRAIG